MFAIGIKIMFMKKIVAFILLLISLQSFSQIDAAIDAKIKSAIASIPAGSNQNVDSLLKSAIKEITNVLVYDTVLQRRANGAANLDTLTSPVNTSTLYEISISGDASLLRLVVVTNKAGVYSSRFTDELTWVGVATGSKLNTTTISNRVIVATVGATGNIVYQRAKKVY